MAREDHLVLKARALWFRPHLPPTKVGLPCQCLTLLLELFYLFEMCRRDRRQPHRLVRVVSEAAVGRADDIAGITILENPGLDLHSRPSSAAPRPEPVRATCSATVKIIEHQPGPPRPRPSLSPAIRMVSASLPVPTASPERPPGQWHPAPGQRPVLPKPQPPLSRPPPSADPVQVLQFTTFRLLEALQPAVQMHLLHQLLHTTWQLQYHLHPTTWHLLRRLSIHP